MGWLTSEEYEALDDAGKTWTKSVSKKNWHEKTWEALEEDNAPRISWLLKKYKGEYYAFRKEFVDRAVASFSFDSLRVFLTYCGTSFGPGSYDDDRKYMYRMLSAAASKKNDALWDHARVAGSGFLRSEDVMRLAFNADWVEKVEKMIGDKKKMDQEKYLFALKEWPLNSEENYSVIVSWRENLPEEQRRKVMDEALYHSVAEREISRAEFLIKNGGANIHHSKGKYSCAVLREAIQNEDPDMLDMLMANGADTGKIGRFYYNELRMEKPFSPMLVHIEKYIDVAKEKTKDQTIEGYSLADAETLMHRQALPGTDITLTTTFNFRRSQQIVVTSAEGKISTETKEFNDVLSPEAIESLREKFEALGGVSEHPKDRMRAEVKQAFPKQGGSCAPA